MGRPVGFELTVRACCHVILQYAVLARSLSEFIAKVVYLKGLSPSGSMMSWMIWMTKPKTWAAILLVAAMDVTLTVFAAKSSQMEGDRSGRPTALGGI